MKDLELYDIYSTWHVPFWQTRLFVIALAVFGLLLCAGALWWFYKKYRKNKSVDIEQQILAQLNAMRLTIIATPEDAQKAYAAITDALKSYFQYYYASPFKTLTDYQMHQALVSKNFPIEYHEALEKLLENGMHVKFARAQALQQQVTSHVALCINIINHLVRARKSS
ncbi:hypothetical protein BH09DEP1_BH09DEP1_5890 [soil metagenome]